MLNMESRDCFIQSASCKCGICFVSTLIPACLDFKHWSLKHECFTGRHGSEESFKVYCGQCIGLFCCCIQVKEQYKRAYKLVLAKKCSKIVSISVSVYQLWSLLRAKLKAMYGFLIIIKYDTVFWWVIFPSIMKLSENSEFWVNMYLSNLCLTLLGFMDMTEYYLSLIGMKWT